ncbi:MAG: hypothetical protein ACLQDV_25180 [Candidatus Binataceae bacterium]
MMLVVLWPLPTAAHFNSPDVFFRSDTTQYPVVVRVAMPAVVPGIAEVEVQSSSKDLRSVFVCVTKIVGAGAAYSPQPQQAVEAKDDPSHFRAEVWVMEEGALLVRLLFKGARGAASLGIPVAAAPRQVYAMPRWMTVMLSVMLALYVTSGVALMGAAVGTSGLRVVSHLENDGEALRRKSMIIAAVCLLMGIIGGAVWWRSEDQYHQTKMKFFRSPGVLAFLTGQNRLILNVSDSSWDDHINAIGLLPDHGHIMHLFLLRIPALDEMWHLHPEQNWGGSFSIDLPSMSSGKYQIFADLVDGTGFPWTLVGTTNLPSISGREAKGDDSSSSAPPIDQRNCCSQIFHLPDGCKMVFATPPDQLRTGVSLSLHFVVEDSKGTPALDLQPYMGMLAHAELVRWDRGIFAHLHPSGSVPMASLMLADSRGVEPTGGTDYQEMCIRGQEQSGPDLTFPYGFSGPGYYRIFVQFKRNGHVDTGVFDLHVLS